jgi:hypothetical protein
VSNIDLNQYKWILGTGCSYGAMVRSVMDPFDSLVSPTGDIPKQKKGNYPKKIHETNDTIISINIPLTGHGVKWQSDCIIYLTNFLLKQGVKSENIYCFVEWSQWTRETAHFTHLLDLDIKSIEFNPLTYSTHDVRINCSKNGIGIDILELDTWPELEKIINSIDIGTSEPNGVSTGHIGGNVHFTVFNSNPKHLGDYLGPDYEFLLEETARLSNSTPIEYRIKRYLETIIYTQNFLKLNNISYNFIQMQSDFDNWTYDDYKIVHVTTQSSHLTDELISETRGSSRFIEKVFPQFKFIFEQIDLDNFWFYQNEKMERGGIDEWALSELGDSAYSYVLSHNIVNNRVILADYEIDDKLPRFGNHPIELLYILIWNDVASNCKFLKVKPELENWIRELYFEDYNYDGDSKNFFVLSKKYIDKIQKL